MLENFWFVLLIGVLIGAVIGGTVAGFACYRIGYNKMKDKAHDEARRLRLLSWNR